MRRTALFGVFVVCVALAFGVGTASASLVGTFQVNSSPPVPYPAAGSALAPGEFTVTGDSVYLGTACGSVIAPPPGVTVGVILRGICTFAVKLENARLAGYSGVVFVNQASSGPDEVIFTSGTPITAPVPAVGVSYNTGLAIFGGTLIPAIGTLGPNVTLTGTDVADLTVAKSHVGNFTQGQTGAQYTITASNSGAAASTETVSVVDTLPAGLTATDLSGLGWTCSLGTMTCTRSDSLAAGSAYPPITVTVNVAYNASSSVTNTATVSGGGETTIVNDTATDPTTIAPKCTPVGDGWNLTAAIVRPSAPVTGTVDARGCDIGVYFARTIGSVTNAEIYGATSYGVFVYNAPVNITNSSIHDIGDTPFSGAQHGVGIFYTSQNVDGQEALPHDASGTVSGNTITAYQKNGIVIRGQDANVTVKTNTVTGAGMIDWIAQNGIEFISGARGLVQGNTISSNWYTPKTWVACGLLFYQAGGVKQQANVFVGNEVNVCNAGRGGGDYKP